jgi:sensor histidine kinase YesM
MKILLSFILFFSVSFSQTQEICFNANISSEAWLARWKYTEGDSLIWSQPGYSDLKWKICNWNNLTIQTKGNHWLRTKIYVNNESGSPIFLRFTIFLYPCEIYYDGELLGINGVVGNNAEMEKQGLMSKAFALTYRQSKSGVHTISVRFSNFNGPVGSSVFRARIDNYIYEHLYRPEYMFRLIATVSIYFTAVIFGLALFFSGKRFKHYLFFSLMCLPTLLIKGYQFYIYYFNLPSFHEEYYIFGYKIAEYVSNIFLIIFILLNFKFTEKKIHLGIWCVLCITHYFLGLENIYFYVPFILYQLFLFSNTVKRKMAGGLTMLIGFIITTTPVVMSMAGYQINILILQIASFLFIMFIMFAVSRQVLEQQEIQRSIEIRSHRLETDLLKKSIQPHFIVNTLSSIKALARKEPDKSEALIQALASEFRIINKISAEKEISILEELELCEYHLQIMGLRLDAKFDLIKNNIFFYEKIPPLIFHTLVENGITHAFKPRESGSFWLSSEKKNGYITYEMQNDGSLLNTFPEDHFKVTEEGMGIKYVKARLDESYPGKWRMDYGLKDSKWFVKIEICR